MSANPIALAALVLIGVAPTIRAQEAPKEKPSLGEALRRIFGGKKGYEAKKLPSGPGSLTWPRFRREQLRWKIASFISSYEKHGERNRQWDDGVRAAIESYLRWVSETRGRDERWRDRIVDKLVVLRQRECKDPFVAYILGAMRFVMGEVDEAERLLLGVDTALKKSPYPAFASFYCVRKLSALYKHKGDKAKSDAYMQRTYERIARMAADPDVKKNGQRYWIQEMYATWGADEDVPPEYMTLLGELRKTKGVDPWILSYITGICEIKLAWKARGIEYADKVTDAGWAGFEKHIARADRALRAAHALRPAYPNAAAKMLTIVMAQSAEADELREWFDRSVAAQFDYAPAYTGLTWAYRPRWGGSLQLMLDLGVECLHTGRFDTRVPDHFLKTLLDLADELDGGIFETVKLRGVHDQLRIFVKGMCAAPSRKGNESYYRSLLLCSAFVTGNKKEAAELDLELGDSFDSRLAEAFNLDERVVRAELALLRKAKAKK